MAKYHDLTVTCQGGHIKWHTVLQPMLQLTQKIPPPRFMFTWQESLIPHYSRGFVGLLRDKLNSQRLVVLEFASAKNPHFSYIHYYPR